MRGKLSLTLSVLLLGAPAGAQTLGTAREDRADAQAKIQAISGDFGALSKQYSRIQARANMAAAHLVDALMIQSQLEADAASSRALLDDRADAIYRAGPAAFMDVLLGSTGPGDFLARQELVERALGDGVEDAAAAVKDLDAASDLVAELEEARTELVRQ
ncbi:MAG: hypothetical protein ACRDH9_05880, partial [Actinomycetota bacterium]